MHIFVRKQGGFYMEETRQVTGDNGFKGYEVGDVVTGKVAKIEEKQALIDIGHKFDAILPISEVSNVHIEKISDVLNEGDQFKVKVKKVNEENEEIVVSKKAVDADEAWDKLTRKLQTGEIFEATVAEVVKGGLVVDVGVRGFIPASHIELSFVEDYSEYKGRTLRLKVLELDRENNRVILSQRAVLEEEHKKEKEKVFDQLKEGSVIEGTVDRLTDFGAFINLGGIDGLVHVSEMSWEHIDHPSQVVKVGERVKVKVLRVDRDNERISLSMKALMESPWDQAAKTIQVGMTVKGVVRRLVSFGAFIEIQPGVEGLVHISQISNRRVGSPAEVLQVGQEVEAKVLDVNVAEKRISLSIKELQDNPKIDEDVKVKLEEVKSLGVSIGDRIGEEIWKKLK